MISSRFSFVFQSRRSIWRRTGKLFTRTRSYPSESRLAIRYRSRPLRQTKQLLIPKRSSDLPFFIYRLNAELNRTVTLLRAERLSLKGSHFQLECENASLRTALERAESRERELMARQEGQVRGSWGGMDQDQVEVSMLLLALLSTLR